jgi:hypothetical protein
MTMRDTPSPSWRAIEKPLPCPGVASAGSGGVVGELAATTGADSGGAGGASASTMAAVLAGDACGRLRITAAVSERLARVAGSRRVEDGRRLSQ